MEKDYEQLNLDNDDDIVIINDSYDAEEIENFEEQIYENKDVNNSKNDKFNFKYKIFNLNSDNIFDKIKILFIVILIIGILLFFIRLFIYVLPFIILFVFAKKLIDYIQNKY